MSEIKLPFKWKNIFFGELCTIGKESVQPTDNPNINYVGLEHIDPGNPKLTRWGIASEVKSSKSKFYPGDVLYGKLRPYLDKAVLASFEGICSTDILVFKTNGLIKPEFLTYLIHTKEFIAHAIKTTRGVNHPRTSWTYLTQFNFPLPTLHEQNDIVHILQTVQKAKETCHHELELERERKTTLMQYLFTQGTRNESRKPTEIGEIPNSWNLVHLKEVADIVYGVQAAVANLTDDSVGIPIFTNINITNRGTLDLTTLRYYEIADSKKEKLILRPGDLLFNWRSGSQNHVGKTALFDLQGEYTFSSFILRFRANDKINNIYLFYYLQYLKFQDFFARKSSQSSINSVFNASNASVIPIMLPSNIDEQSEISKFLTTCDCKISALEKEIATLDELYQAMLEQLMTGKISTQELTEIHV
ncbi:restriction endonuclease subunit S [Nostoc sp. CHAB 5834]|nr:restriction endonuclease subunit S [Nostoc sp. CHAB 5834]